MNGIIILPLVPLLKNDSENSEMLTQLLFGEKVEILETSEKWLKIRNLADDCVGWTDRKMIRNLTPDDEIQLSDSTVFRVKVPLSVCKKTTTTETMFLPGGSLLFSIAENDCKIGDENFKVNESDISKEELLTGENIVNIAGRYLNAPFLWGGKSILGIDCSGLVQVVFSILGKQIPRYASQQVESGKVVDFLSEVQPGDLAFFENTEGQIIHSGILLNSHQIIHTSGWVKIETIDSQGIISSQNEGYTYKLRIIKRLI